MLSVVQWARLAEIEDTGILSLTVADTVAVSEVVQTAPFYYVVVESVGVSDDVSTLLIPLVVHGSETTTVTDTAARGLAPPDTGFTPRERRYLSGLFVRTAATVAGDIHKQVIDPVTVTEAVSTSGVGGVSLVPVLIPSYRRRRMV